MLKQTIQPLFPQSFKISSKPSKFCPGCGHSIALKELGFAIDELGIQQKAVLGLDIGCALLAWDFFDFPTVQTHHGRTIPVMSGYKYAVPEKICLAYLGDGGGYAIGLQALITACKRNDPITVILINNTLYAMTGGQMAPTTMCGEKTTSTPEGRICQSNEKPFLGPELLKSLANQRAFIARGVVSQPLPLRELIKQAINHQIKNKSFAFLEILSICPVNWKMDSKQSLDRLEKEMSKIFPLGEIKCESY